VSRTRSRGAAFVALFLLAGSLPGFAAGELKAAVGKSAIQLPPGIPLAGYGGDRRMFPDVLGLYPYAFYLKPSQGTLDSIHVKVLVLDRADQSPPRLVFVALDLVAVSAQMRADVLGKLGPGYDPAGVFLSATHTHSGPGALFDNDFAEFVGSDRFVQSLYDDVLDQIVAAVQATVLQLKPAALEAVDFEACCVQLSRRGWSFDRSAHVLFVKSGSRHLGALVNLAMHGTQLHDSNLELSADLPGAIAAELGRWLGALQSEGPLPVLFVNGAEGDVVHAPGKDMQQTANEFRAQVATQTRYAVDGSWSVARSTVELGPATHTLGPFKSELPDSARIAIDLRSWMPQQVEIAALRLGRLRMLTWPGEPTGALALAARALCLLPADMPLLVLGLTDAHVGYFTTPAQFETGEYEAKNSMYGPHAGHKLLNEHCKLLQML
jgi:hypothetical protein